MCKKTKSNGEIKQLSLRISTDLYEQVQRFAANHEVDNLSDNAALVVLIKRGLATEVTK
jgi:hypothetical protein